MYGFGGSGASRSEIWLGVTIAGRTTKQSNKERESYSANGLWKAEMSNELLRWGRHVIGT